MYERIYIQNGERHSSKEKITGGNESSKKFISHKPNPIRT